MTRLLRKKFENARQLDRLFWRYLDFMGFCKEHKITIERNAVGILQDGLNLHYRISYKVKRDGGIREILIPDKSLWAYQRFILEKILYRVACSPIAHGGVPGRSITTFIAPHHGARSLFHVDISNAFGSVSLTDTLRQVSDYSKRTQEARWIEGFDLELEVFKIMLELCEISNDYHRYLPQGAPTSPYLFNLALAPLHKKLERLAKNVRGNVTQWADDIVFSMPSEEIPAKLRRAIIRIVQESGLVVKPEKTVYLHHANTKNHPLRIGGVNIIDGEPRLSPRQIKHMRAKAFFAEKDGDLAYLAGARGYLKQIYSLENWPRQLQSLIPPEWIAKSPKPSPLALSHPIGEFPSGFISKKVPESICPEIYPLAMLRPYPIWPFDGDPDGYAVLDDEVLALIKEDRELNAASLPSPSVSPSKPWWTGDEAPEIDDEIDIPDALEGIDWG